MFNEAFDAGAAKVMLKNQYLVVEPSKRFEFDAKATTPLVDEQVDESPPKGSGVSVTLVQVALAAFTLYQTCAEPTNEFGLTVTDTFFGTPTNHVRYVPFFPNAGAVRLIWFVTVPG
jgi:hypothetical protein